jgi:hypothetical protein
MGPCRYRDKKVVGVFVRFSCRFTSIFRCGIFQIYQRNPVDGVEFLYKKQLSRDFRAAVPEITFILTLVMQDIGRNTRRF